MIYKWNIYFADLGPVIGSEQKGICPVLIISDEDYSTLMPVVTILPITTIKAGRRIYPNEALLSRTIKMKTGLSNDSLVLAHQIRTISKKRLARSIGNIENSDIRFNVEEALRVHLNL